GDTIEGVFLASRQDGAHSRLTHHLTQCDLQFDLSNDLDLIGSLVAFLQELLRCMPLGDETERLRVGIAVEEALKNAYYHGSLEVATGAGWPQRKAVEQIARERLFEEPYRNRRISVPATVSRAEARRVIA